jgi:hypothetical protein
MSVFLTDEHRASSIFPLARPGVGPDAGARLSRLLPIIREIVSDIETLTLPGQRLTMAKVVELIEDRVRDLAPVLGVRNGQAIEELVARLAHEAERLCPDVTAFNHGAESLLALLGSLCASGPLALPIGAGVFRVRAGGVQPGIDADVDVGAAPPDEEGDGDGEAEGREPGRELEQAAVLHGLLGLPSTV